MRVGTGPIRLGNRWQSGRSRALTPIPTRGGPAEQFPVVLPGVAGGAATDTRGIGKRPARHLRVGKLHYVRRQGDAERERFGTIANYGAALKVQFRRHGRWLDYLRLGVAVLLTIAAAYFGRAALKAQQGLDRGAPSGIGRLIDPVPAVVITGSLVSLMIALSTIARARADRKSDDTEERYENLFNGVPLPMLLFDAETLQIVAVNGAAIHHYGYSRAEFLAMTIRELRPADGVPAMYAILMEPPQPYQQAGGLQHRKKDGTIIDVEITRHPMRFEGRNVIAVVAFDVSDRIRAETAMRESEERFSQMTNHINETFFVVDTRTGQTLYLSPNWAEISGRPSHETNEPASWFADIHPDDRDAIATTQATVLRGEAATNVFRVVRPDGTIRWARGRSFPVRNAAGEVYRMVGVVADITELREAEARFAQSQKMEAVGRLAGGIAHDFNNLLTVILGEADQLKDALVTGSPQSSSVQEIRKAGERAATLTRQLLAFSRRQMVDPVVFDVTAAVHEMSNMCRRLIGEDIELITRFAPDTWTARADPGHIEQVLANLVVNARDAMPGGGTLTIETSNVTLDVEYVGSRSEVRPGDYVLITVSDTGTGMSDAVRARMFEPFFTTKETGKGTGLGLATCYGIVKQSEGHIAVYSELGIGTTVKVYLPRGGAAAPAALPIEAVDSLPRGGETILVVEDETAVRRIVMRLLSAQGYHVLEAKDGAEAAAITATHPGNIDLLFTDVVLPGIGGREIAERAQAQRPGLRVLFTSGYTDDMILQHRLLEKDVALLQKPFSRDSITRKVREVLDAPVAVLAGV